MEEKKINKNEDKEPKKKKRASLKSILGGDILATDFFRRQTKLLVLIMVFIIFYIHNRYASQQQQIEIDKLKKELIDIKYDALTRSSELMERSRQSRIEEYISTKESDLQTSTNPPYLIESKKEKGEKREKGEWRRKEKVNYQSLIVNCHLSIVIYKL